MDVQTELATLLADVLAHLDAFRRDGGEVVPSGTLEGLGPAPEWGPVPVQRPAAGPGPARPWSPSPANTPAPVRPAPPLPAPSVRAPSPDAPRFPSPAASPVRPQAPSPAYSAPPPAPPSSPARPSAAPALGAAMFGEKWLKAAADPAAELKALYRDVGDCQRCGRCQTRSRILHGEGAPRSPLLLLTGAPSPQEDLGGRLFPGPAGEMLDNMLVKVLARERSDVHIAPALLCAGGDIAPDEAAACRGWLDRRVQVVQPKVILAMGRAAAVALGLPPDRPGWYTYGTTPVCYTHHPEELLARPGDKRTTLEHLKEVRARIG